MAFFSAQNAGLAFMIVAVVNIIAAIIAVVLAVMDVEGFTENGVVYYAICAVGELITSGLYFMYGQKVRNGQIDRKIDILATFVKIVGITMIIGGLFAAAAVIAIGADIGAALIGMIVPIILGLIVIFIASKINDGKQTIGDKLIWIILLVVFVLSILVAIVEIISIVGILYGICDLIIYSFMVLLLIDEEVKSEMGI
jgi:hypothetical protein